MKTICFVCGSKGANSILYIKPRSRGAYFSFLENHEPPKGAKLPNGEGIVSACLVCYAFLNQQWDSFERTKTPLVKRLYWLKRVDNRSFTGAELNVQGEYVAQIMGVQYNCGMSGNISPFDYGSHTGISCSIKDLLPSPTNDSNLSLVIDAPEVRGGEFNGVLDLSVSPKKLKAHSKKLQKSEDINGINGSKVLGTNGSKALGTNGSKAFGTSGSKALGIDATNGPKHKNISVVCYVCRKTCSASLARFVYAIKHADDEPYFPFILGLAEPSGAMALTKNGVTQVCSECRKTLSRQWRIFESRKVPEMERVYKIHDIPIMVEKTTKEDEHVGDTSVATRSSGSACYLCGEITLLSLMYTLKTRELEAEEDSGRIVLPFIEKLKCPLGARPINSRGTVLVCSLCHNHILNQWKKFEENNLPLDSREYMLRPFLSASGSVAFPADPEKSNPIELKALEKKNLQKAPSLTDGKTLSKAEKESVEFSRDVLHPFLFSRCAADVRTVVSFSDPAFRMPYPLPLLLKTDCNKNMTTRPEPTALADGFVCNGHASAQELAEQSTETGLTCCFLCSCKCKKQGTNWKSVVSIYDRPSPDVARRSEDSKTCFVRPFFPFLSTLAPSAGAESISNDGRADICHVCYQSLIGQWFTFEKSKDLEEQNRWLRKYRFRCYMCTICKQSLDRSSVEIVTTQDFPVLESIDGLVSVEGSDSALVCVSCLETLRCGGEQTGKKCGKPERSGQKRPRTVSELSKVEPRDNQHQTKTSSNSSSLTSAAAAAAAAKETDKQSLSSSSPACSSSSFFSSSSSPAYKGIKTITAEEETSSADAVAAAERETRSRRRIEKGSEEPNETPPPPPQHLFPRAASASAAAAAAGESSSSYLEALKKLTMDSCSRTTSASCLNTHDFSKPSETETGVSRKEAKSVLSIKDTNLLEEHTTTVDDVVRRKFHAAEVAKKGTDYRSNGQLPSAKEEWVTKCKRSSSTTNSATNKAEDGGCSASTPTKSSPSWNGDYPSLPLSVPAAAAAAAAASDTAGGGRLGCNGFIPSTDRMLNSTLSHPSVLQPLQPHPSAPPMQLSFMSRDGLYLPQLFSSTPVFGYPPLLPSSSSTLRWDDYLAIQRLQHQQQQLMSPSSFAAPYSSLFPTSLLHPLLQPTSFSSPFLCMPDRTAASTGLSSTFDLSSILHRSVYERREAMDAAGPPSNGEVESGGFWNSSAFMKNSCCGSEKEVEERNSGNNCLLGHGHLFARRKSTDRVKERQPQGDEKPTGAQRRKDSKPNFHRPFLENCSGDEEDEKVEEPEMEENEPGHLGREDEQPSSEEADPEMGKVDETQTNKSGILQTESYSDRAPAVSAGLDALAENGHSRLVAEFGQPKNGHLAAVVQPKLVDGLCVNGSVNAVRYGSSHLSKDELLSAALSLISLQSPRVLSLAKRTVSDRESTVALDNESTDNDRGPTNNDDLSSEETNPWKRRRLDLDHVIARTSSKLNNGNCTKNKNDGKQTLPIDRLLSLPKPSDEEMQCGPSSPWPVSDRDDNQPKAFHLQWPGIEAIIESYQQYCQDYASEKQFLVDQGRQSAHSRRDLISAGETFSAKTVELTQMRQDLESERSQLQSYIDSLMCCLRQLR